MKSGSDVTISAAFDCSIHMESKAHRSPLALFALVGFA